MGKMADVTEDTLGQTLDDPRDDGGAIPQWLLDQLLESEPDIRIEAVEALSTCREDLAINSLIERAQTDADRDVRCTALLALGQFIYLGSISEYGTGDPELFEEISQEDYDRTLAFLLSVYRDESLPLDERRSAVEALGFGAGDDVVQAISELYARPDKESKISALRAMGRNGALAWLDVVGRELYSDDLDIQIEAIDAAGEMSADLLGKDLLRLTYADDREVVLSALWALGQTGWEGAFDRLDEMSLHPDVEIREVADEAMDEWLLFNGLTSDHEEAEDVDPLDID